MFLASSSISAIFRPVSWGIEMFKLAMALSFVATQALLGPDGTRFVILDAEQGATTITVRASAINYGNAPESGWTVLCQALGAADNDMGSFESHALRLPRVKDTIANMKDFTFSGLVKGEGVVNLECRLVAPKT